MEYHIYHIKGIKIGCSTNPKKRVKSQGYTNWEILETHIDIEIAADREIELQKQYGYKVDLVRYDAVDYKLNGNILASKWAKINGIRCRDSGHIQTIQKIGCVLGGQVSGNKKTKEYMTELSKLGVKANIQNYGIKLRAINKDTNEISVFDSIGQAESALNIASCLISRCLRGKQRYSKGYSFERI